MLDIDIFCGGFLILYSGFYKNSYKFEIGTKKKKKFTQEKTFVFIECEKNVL